jgi:hypothetical protein
MATKHFITNERFIITYDDVNYQFNPYSPSQKTEVDSPSWELVRKSTFTPVIEGFAGIGTNILDPTGITTGTFLGLPRLTLP